MTPFNQISPKISSKSFMDSQFNLFNFLFIGTKIELFFLLLKYQKYTDQNIEFNGNLIKNEVCKFE